MNRQKQSMVIVLVSFISLFIGYLSADITQVQSTQPLLAGLQQAGKAGSLVTIAKEFMQHFADLDYATSKQLVIPVPATGYELVYHWGFLGSGDLFSPLPQVKAQFRPLQTVTHSADSAHALTDLGKVMVQNELFKKSKQLPLVKWLSESEISPIKLLIVKSMLLIKSNATLGIDSIKYELFRLLFRLSLVDDIVLFDVSKPLTSYIPETIKFALDELSPEIAKTIDEVWINVMSSKSLVQDMQSNGDLACVTAYAFNDAACAQSCFTNLQVGDVCTAVEQAVHQHGYSLVGYEDLIDLSKIAAPNQNLNPALRLVGKKSYGIVNVQQGCSGLPMAVCQQFKEQPASNVVLVENVQGKSWIVCKGGNLDTVQTAKVFAAALIVAFKDYIGARKKIMASTSSQALAYKAALQQRELEHVRRMNFMTSEYGKASVQRLGQALAALEGQSSEQVVPYQTQQADKLELELAQLRIELKKKQENLVTLCNAAKRAQGESLRIAQLTVATAQQQCQELERQITTHQKNLAAYKTLKVRCDDVNNTHVAQKRAEYQQHIDALNTILRKDQTLEATQQQDIKNCIAQLEQSMQQLTLTSQQAQASDYLEKLLYKRNNAARIYVQEAKTLQNELAQAQTQLALITDLPIRTAKMLEFSSFKKDFELYIASLEQQATKIKEENEKLKELEACKQAYAGLVAEAVDAQLIEKIQALEFEVGYLMNTNAASWLKGLLYASSDIKACMDDLQSGSLEEFKQVKERFLAKLSFIAQHSEHVQENLLLYRHLVGLIIPEFLPAFDLCTNK